MTTANVCWSRHDIIQQCNGQNKQMWNTWDLRAVCGKFSFNLGLVNNSVFFCQTENLNSWSAELKSQRSSSAHLVCFFQQILKLCICCLFHPCTDYSEIPNESRINNKLLIFSFSDSFNCPKDIPNSFLIAHMIYRCDRRLKPNLTPKEFANHKAFYALRLKFVCVCLTFCFIIPNFISFVFWTVTLHGYFNF